MVLLCASWFHGIALLFRAAGHAYPTLACLPHTLCVVLLLCDFLVPYLVPYMAPYHVFCAQVNQVSSDVKAGRSVDITLPGVTFYVTETLEADFRQWSFQGAISIRGQGKGKTILDCRMQRHAISILGAASVTLSDMTIQYCGEQYTRTHTHANNHEWQAHAHTHTH